MGKNENVTIKNSLALIRHTVSFVLSFFFLLLRRSLFIAGIMAEVDL